MHRINPRECLIDPHRILIAKLGEKDFLRLFPVEMDEFDPMSEPEPSVGALVRLENSQCIGICYGKITHTLSIVKPIHDITEQVIRRILEEIKFPDRSIVWASGQQIYHR